jgi:hypothetical protein
MWRHLAAISKEGQCPTQKHNGVSEHTVPFSYPSAPSPRSQIKCIVVRNRCRIKTEPIVLHRCRWPWIIIMLVISWFFWSCHAVHGRGKPIRGESSTRPVYIVQDKDAVGFVIDVRCSGRSILTWSTLASVSTTLSLSCPSFRSKAAAPARGTEDKHLSSTLSEEPAKLQCTFLLSCALEAF